jgi:hypothetical protein
VGVQIVAQWSVLNDFAIGPAWVFDSLYRDWFWVAAEAVGAAMGLTRSTVGSAGSAVGLLWDHWSCCLAAVASARIALEYIWAVMGLL